MPASKIETHLSYTPTANNQENPYSLGVLYLTKAEADEIAEFITRVQCARVTDKPKPIVFDNGMLGRTAGATNWLDDLRDKAKSAGVLYVNSSTTDAPGTVQSTLSDNKSLMWTGREWLPVEAIGELVRRRREMMDGNADADRYAAMQMQLTPEQRDLVKDEIARRGFAVDKPEEQEQVAPRNRFSGLDIE